MSKAWGKPSLSEEVEAEVVAQQQDQQHLDSSSFPSLNEAASTKPKKKKQQQTFTLAEFTVGKFVGPGGKSRFPVSDSKGLTADEMMALPTGPRERSEEEDRRGGLGGGFKDYGAYRGGRDGGDRERDRNFGGSFERERSGDGFGRRDRLDESSRADESDDWGASKKAVPPRGTYEDDARRGSRMSDREDEPSRADESADWVSSKKTIPSRGAYEDDGRRRGRLSDRDLPSKVDANDNWASNKKAMAPPSVNGRGARRYDPDSQMPSRADEADNWGATKKYVPNVPGDPCLGEFDSFHKDRDSGSDPDRWGRIERQRLVLQPRTRHFDSSSGPTSGSEIENILLSDGPEQQRQNRTAKVSPFGDARPREQVLAGRLEKSDFKVVEKGVDGVGLQDEVPNPHSTINSMGEANPREALLEDRSWKKTAVDVQRRSLDRPDPKEEVHPKEEVKAWQEVSKWKDWKRGEKCNTLTDVNGEQSNHLNAKEPVTQERKLGELTQSLNDKVCFSARDVRYNASHTNVGMVSEKGRELERGVRW